MLFRSVSQSRYGSAGARRLEDYDELRKKLDTSAETLRKSVERERWECHQLAETVTDDHRLSYVECPRCGSHIADAIAARGAMCGPEEEG